MKALGQAQSALAALAELLPDDAERIGADGSDHRWSALDALRVGDIVLVRPGGRVPADGTIVDGDSRARRIDGHRGVAAGGEGRRATASSPGPSRPTPRSACGSKRSATTPRSPASSDSSPRRSRRRAVRRRSPTDSPRCSSTSPPGPAVVTFVVWALRRRHGRGRRADRDRARHRLPARARAGDPAGHLAVQRARGAGGHPDQEPARPRTDAHHRRGPLRQDRHAHQGRARRHRRRRRRTSARTRCCGSRPPSKPTASIPLARAIVAAASSDSPARRCDRLPLPDRPRRRGHRRRQSLRSRRPGAPPRARALRAARTR